MQMFEQAQALHLQGKLDEAEELYVRLLEQNPRNGGLLATLGTLYLQKNRLGMAIHLLDASIMSGECDKQSDILSNLGLAYKTAGDVKRAKHYFERSIKYAPSAESLANYSALFVEAGDPKKSERICRQAIGMNAELPIAHWNLALTLLGEGKWDEAWKEHEWGLEVGGMRLRREVANLPDWDGSPGKTLHVYGEQGIGDEIMFASMLPDVMKTNPVVFECHERLVNLFKHSFPDIPIYGTREQSDVPDWVKDHKLDAHIPIGSLGKFYRTSRESFPGTAYLHTDSAPRGEKFRVGISWTGGGIKMGRVLKRSVPLAWWKSILSIPDVEFVSLQYTEDAGSEIRTVENMGGYSIRQYDEIRAHDYNETAKLVKSCDLVISICTSVIHLAGALGVPCWILTPKWPAWRYQNHGGMPWYRSVRMYRQTEASPEDAYSPEPWRPVIERIALDLDNLITQRRAIAA